MQEAPACVVLEPVQNPQMGFKWVGNRMLRWRHPDGGLAITAPDTDVALINPS